MAVTVTIASTDRSDYVLIPSLRISMGYRAPWTASFVSADAVSTSGAYRPALHDTVVIADGATTVFRGWVFAVVDEPVAPPRTGTRVNVTCRAYDAILDATIVDKTYGTDPVTIANSSVASPTSITTSQPHGFTTGDRVVIEDHAGSTAAVNGTHAVIVTSASTFTVPVNNTTSGGGGTVRKVTPADDIVADLHATYLNSRGITLDTLSSAGDVSKVVYAGASLRDVLDQITTITGWPYRVTPAPQLQFFSVGTKTASYSLTTTNNVGAVTWEQRRERYINTVRLTYGTEGLKEQTAVITGDGSTNQWRLSYFPAVDVNGFLVSQGYVADTGVYSPLGQLTDIATSSVAASSTITTRQPHGLTSGESVVIQGHSGSTPSINSTHTVTVTGVYTFTIPVNVTVAGTGGSCYRSDLVWLWYPTSGIDTTVNNSLFRVGALTSEHIATLVYSVQYPQVVIVNDAGEVASRGVWEGTFEAPDVTDAATATELAEGILRRELATPKIMTTATRQGFVMPGDQITATYTDRTISGSLLIQQVEVTADIDKRLRYTITAVTGTEYKDSADDIQMDVYNGGGLRTAGGTITGGNLIAQPSGIVPGTVQGSRVIVERDPAAIIEWHPVETPDPDATERRTVIIEANASLFHCYEQTQSSADSFGTIDYWYVDRSTQATTFGGAVTAPSVDVSTTLSLPGAAAITQLNNITDLQPNSQSINNATAVAIGGSGSVGFLFVDDASNASSAIFYIRGGANAVDSVYMPAGWSTTAGTGSSRNVYWSGGNSRYELQNNSGGTVTFRITMLGTLN